MRSVVHFILVVSLICPISYADNPMNAAIESVNASLENARTRARAAIVEDMNFALSEVLMNIAKETDLSEVRSRIFTEQSELQEAFERLASLDESEISQLNSTAMAVFEEYRRYVRQRFDASFIAPEARFNALESIRLASRSLRAFENRCDSGRGTSGGAVPPFMYPDPPKASYRIYMSIGNQGFNGDANYNGTGSQAEENRNNIANVSLSAASIVTSIALSGESGAAVAYCQAAMPWALGGGVVIALGMMYLNHLDRIKLAEKIVKAKVYAFHETASDEDVAQFYREGCETYKGRTKAIRQVLDAALTNPEELERLAATSEAFDKSLEDFQGLLEKHDSLKKEILELDEANADAATKEKKVKELLAVGEEISKQASPEKIANMMLRVLIAKRADLESKLTTISWDLVDQMQRQAFQKIQKIMRLVQKRNFAKYLKGNDELSKDLVSLDEFLTAKGLFKDTLTLQIKEIFGRVSIEEVKQAESVLAQATRALTEKYGHNREVMEFARQVSVLIGGI